MQKKIKKQRIIFNSSEKNLYKKIQKAYYDALAAREKYESSKVALEAAEEVFNYMTKSYENGKANLTQYEESSFNVFKMQNNMLKAQYDYILKKKIFNFYKN